MNQCSRKPLLRSCACTQAQLQSDDFQAWGTRLGERPMHMHRKVWEYAYITQALFERGLLSPGKRGLGFAVGQEPLPALFASYGCEILATDLDTPAARQGQWVSTNQHADSLDALNQRGLCDAGKFSKLVSLRYVDMRELPDDLGHFDFIWSACAFEHLGTLALGERFVFDALKYLKSDGVCVHTTEFNVQSNFRTIRRGKNVIYRQRDLIRIARKLRRHGYRIDLDFEHGQLPYDSIIDRPPYTHQASLKVEIHGFVSTSFGLIIEHL